MLINCGINDFPHILKRYPKAISQPAKLHSSPPPNATVITFLESSR